MENGKYKTRPTYSHPDRVRVVEILDDVVVSIDGDSKHKFNAAFFFKVNVLLEKVVDKD